VVLVHGTNGRSASDWFTLAPLLANHGRDVYAFDWHRYHPRPGDPSVTHVHALELAAYVDELQAVTGARRVDVVAHSWGAVVVQYLLRCLSDQPAATAVRSLVGLAPTYGGTTVLGLARRPERFPARLRRWLDATDPIWTEQLPGSAVLASIAAAPPAPAHSPVRCTTIVTRYDRTVTPYTASLRAVPGAEQVVIQDLERRALVGHVGVLHHRAALAQVLRALRDGDSPGFRARW
jgi:triacylglycerol lipase